MPELNHNFIKGRMNLDLDERLVPDGEYRRAMNIEVSTSEGSNVGTVQSVLGNVMASQNIAPNGGNVVGSVANGKTDKIYYLVRCNASGGMEKDLVVEHSASSGASPVVVDIYSIDFTINTLPGVAAQFIELDDSIQRYENIREGMFMIGTVDLGAGLEFHLTETEGFLIDTNTNLLIGAAFGPIQVYSVVHNVGNGTFEVDIRTKTGMDFPVGFPVGTSFTFVAKRALNFQSNKLITGINIIDDFLFWTDDFSEPKRINIKNKKNGSSNFLRHTKFLSLDSNGIYQSNKPLKEEHITVVKKSPLTAPTLEMYNEISGRGLIFGITDDINFTDTVLDNPGGVAVGDPAVYVNPPFPNGTTIDIPFSTIMPDFEIGDILILTTDSVYVNHPEIFTDAEVRVVVIDKTPSILTVKILSFKRGFFPHSTDPISGLPNQRWAICLEQSKSLFEFKFPRFAYRYKYQDGEYSSFSPFSEIAFLPGNFRYDTKEAYNLGMVNQLRFLKILDFVPDGLPKGVNEIDILYKESNSPNIYTVKTIKSTDNEWNNWGHVTTQFPWTGQTRGAIQLESEVIYATVPSNQLLRPWDNVPRKALAQELSANRIIYGNYVEGYNLDTSVNLKTYIKTLDLSNELSHGDMVSVDGSLSLGTGGRSIKSLRTYQVGIVYRDEFGRETPVFTNELASFNIGKELADNYTSLNVQNKSTVPSWADSFKFFIKETSNEYYNLALDRWYDAKDGNMWLAFPSADRNKVDEETYIILKKQHDTNVFVEQEARYKVIAIENEAPDFVRMERISIVRAETSGTIAKTDGQFTIPGTSSGTAVTTGKDFDIGKGGVVVRLYDANGSTDWFEVSSIDKGADASDTGSVKIKGTFGEPGPSIQLPGTISCEIAREVFHNKAEFQGRFFVKVADDGVLFDSLQTGTTDIVDADFTVISQAKQYYMKSSNKDNSWCQKYQWWGESSLLATSWVGTVGNDGAAFFIDEIERDWGSRPMGGTWTSDNGKGLATPTNSNRSGSLANHIEISLSRIDDGSEEGFSISGHDKSQRDFYKALNTEGTWIRWEEDPNGIVYKIKRVRGQGSVAYDDYHGSGIYNYDGGEGKERTWKSNKTKRLYITLEATEWVDPGGTGYVKANIKGSPPTWVSSAIDDEGIPNFTTQVPNDPGSWNPTVNSLSTTGSATTQHSIAQGSNNYDVSASSYAGTPITYDNPYYYNNLQLVRKYEPESIKEMSEQPAIFETEPKEDIGLDIYYEMDQTFPTEINGKTNELFAKIGSSVRTDFGSYSCSINPSANITKALCDTAGGIWEPDAFIETWKDYTPPAPGWMGTWDGPTGVPGTPGYLSGSTTLNFPGGIPGAYVGKGDRINNLIPTYFPPGTVVIEVVDDNTIVVSAEALVAGTNTLVIFTKVTMPRITHWDDNIIRLDCEAINPQVQVGNGVFADNIKLPIAMAADPHSLVFEKLDGGTITGSIFNFSASTDFDGVTLTFSNLLKLGLNRDSSKAKIDLNWFNCYSFGNGVESDRIRDDYNAIRIDKGVKASTTLAEKYQQQRKKNSLIYSGIYNNASGINNLNQFIMAEKITKDLNPRHGSIQKLHAREGDLIALCEDKVFKILANKDALYNADGNPQMIATNRVLGQATPMGGEYGISKNPESFASQAYKAYFSDRSRGVILKLDGKGLVPISDHGMKDWFAENLVNATRVIGSYDDKKDSYNVTLSGSGFWYTVSFGEKTNGWTSFKSFGQEGGISLNNNYYTFNLGNIYRHHQGSTAVFYGGRTDPYVDVLFNQLPGSVKSFGSLKYEGSQSKVTENLVDGEYYNNLIQYGWYVSQGNTNLQQTDELEFKNKEGKWFSRIKGEAYDPDNIDLTEFSFQGIDIASSIVETGIIGCTDPAAENYDPLATADCDGIIGGNDYRCCCYDYGCTDSSVGYFPMLPDNTGWGLDRFQNPCNTPCVDAGGQPIGFAASDYDPKFDCCTLNDPAALNFVDCCNYPAILMGCTDPLAVNYYVGAIVDDGTCCYAGCTDPLANNYNSLACLDDGSCIYNTPCTIGAGLQGIAEIGTGFHPNITIMGSSSHLSNSNWFKVSPGSISALANLSIGCEVTSQYLPLGTTIIAPFDPTDSNVYLSNTFNNAPSGNCCVHGTCGCGPNDHFTYLSWECGSCDEYNLTVMDLGDDDDSNASTNNGYNVTQYVQSVYGGDIIPNVALLQITPIQGGIIRASDFSITGAPPSGSAGGVPVFSGLYLPSEVAYVKFEDSDNRIYLNYIDPSGTDPNPNYDPSWIPGQSNYVEVIVALNPVQMPYNNLDVEIDIDQVNFQSTTPIVTDITLT